MESAGCATAARCLQWAGCSSQHLSLKQSMQPPSSWTQQQPSCPINTAEAAQQAAACAAQCQGNWVRHRSKQGRTVKCRWPSRWHLMHLRGCPCRSSPVPACSCLCTGPAGRTHVALLSHPMQVRYLCSPCQTLLTCRCCLESVDAGEPPPGFTREFLWPEVS